MAKKAKRRHTGRKKGRRRVGAFDIKSVPWMGIAEVAAGGIVGTYLVNGPLKTTSSANILMVGAGVALALVAPKLWPAGAGIAAAGAISAAQNANFISGTHGMGRMVVNGGPAGSRPIAQVAGGRGRRMMGTLSPVQQNAMNVRNQAAGANRVIIGAQSNHPISAVAGDCN